MEESLIGRLRSNNPSLPTRDRFEAADEIEHLREQLSALEATLEKAGSALDAMSEPLPPLGDSRLLAAK